MAPEKNAGDPGTLELIRRIEADLRILRSQVSEN